MFNEIKGDFKDVAINTFKLGLLAEHGLRKSLTGNLSLVYVNSWIGLTNIRGLRKNSCKIKGRARLSLKRGGISGQNATIITNLGKILLDNLDLQPRK